MEEMKFEETMEKLEQIANTLEKGDLSLEESLIKFEEGMKLSKKCNEILENAQKKITILLSKEGELIEEDFKPEE